MKVSIMEVTPAQAREWLALNTNNRTIRRTVVERYKGDIERGEWQLNGEAIVLNGGSLLDGQHRLLACVEAGKPFQSVVVTDAPETAMQTIDQGVSRSLPDVLKWRGYVNQNQVAAAIRTCWRWDNGMLLRSTTPSISQSLAWLDENDSIISAARFGHRLTAAPLRMRSAVAGPAYFKAISAGGDQAHEFFDRLIDGEHIAHGDPVYALRRALINNAIRVHGRMSPNVMLALVIKAWNAWVQQEPMEVIRWGRGSGGAEKFPVMFDFDGNPVSEPQQ